MIEDEHVYQVIARVDDLIVWLTSIFQQVLPNIPNFIRIENRSNFQLTKEILDDTKMPQLTINIYTSLKNADRNNLIKDFFLDLIKGTLLDLSSLLTNQMLFSNIEWDGKNLKMTNDYGYGISDNRLMNYVKTSIVSIDRKSPALKFLIDLHNIFHVDTFNFPTNVTTYTGLLKHFFEFEQTATQFTLPEDSIVIPLLNLDIPISPMALYNSISRIDDHERVVQYIRYFARARFYYEKKASIEDEEYRLWKLRTDHIEKIFGDNHSKIPIFFLPKNTDRTSLLELISGNEVFEEWTRGNFKIVPSKTSITNPSCEFKTSRDVKLY